MRGDGQVVVVKFDSFDVEVAPTFLLTNGRYWICNTHDGGSYKETDPWAEVRQLETADQIKHARYESAPLPTSSKIIVALAHTPRSAQARSSELNGLKPGIPRWQNTC